ncbi:acyltransferase family protein [Priestia megaterium]
MVNELFFIRAIACIGVVLIHAVSVTFGDFGIRENPNYPMVNAILFVLQILLMFGTPMFIFISEFVLAHRYKGKSPKGFMVKRIKYILIPYISMGIFYSIFRADEQGVTSFDELLLSIVKTIFLGGYHGYFILIIFQFYILHFVFTRYIEGKFNPKYVIISSILINVLYLGFFNFLTPMDVFGESNKFIDLFWNQLSVLPFLGWVAYFTIAYYCGQNFEAFKTSLKRYNKLVLISPFITGLGVLIMCYAGWLTPIQSKRVDMIFYTISVAFFLFYIAMKLKRIPKILVKVSQYSFGIYLLHPFFQIISSKVTFNEYSASSLVINIIFYLAIGILAPVICTILLNKTKIGTFIIGKVGISNKTSKKQQAVA